MRSAFAIAGYGKPVRESIDPTIRLIEAELGGARCVIDVEACQRLRIAMENGGPNCYRRCRHATKLMVLL